MNAVLKNVHGPSAGWATIVHRELAVVCGESAKDVLELALLFASHASVPDDSDALRAFIFGELRQTLARVEGMAVAEQVCEKLAGLLLEKTGVHQLPSANRASFARLKTAQSVAEFRHTTRPRSSHTKALGTDLNLDHNAKALIASLNLDDPGSCPEPELHPVLVLSEHPKAAEGIQQALSERVEVYHHASLDFFESDLLILASRHPVVVLDCRGRYATFCERFLARVDHDLALLAWGGEGLIGVLPGRRMVTCLSNSSPGELAMLVEIFLPQHRYR